MVQEGLSSSESLGRERSPPNQGHHCLYTCFCWYDVHTSDGFNKYLRWVGWERTAGVQGGNWSSLNKWEAPPYRRPRMSFGPAIVATAHLICASCLPLLSKGGLKECRWCCRKVFIAFCDLAEAKLRQAQYKPRIRGGNSRAFWFLEFSFVFLERLLARRHS